MAAAGEQHDRRRPPIPYSRLLEDGWRVLRRPPPQMGLMHPRACVGERASGGVNNRGGDEPAGLAFGPPRSLAMDGARWLAMVDRGDGVGVRLGFDQRAYVCVESVL